MRYIYICVNILIKGKIEYFIIIILMICWEYVIIMLIDFVKIVIE